MRILRTTVRLEEGLLRDAKRLAAQTGRTLTALIEDALRDVLLRARKQPESMGGFDLPVSREGGGVWAGIDLAKTGEIIGRLDAERYRGSPDDSR